MCLRSLPSRHQCLAQGVASRNAKERLRWDQWVDYDSFLKVLCFNFMRHPVCVQRWVLTKLCPGCCFVQNLSNVLVKRSDNFVTNAQPIVLSRGWAGAGRRNTYA